MAQWLKVRREATPEKRKPKLRLSGVRYPSAQRLAYVRALNALLGQIETAVSEVVFPAVPELLSPAVDVPFVRADSLVDHHASLFSNIRNKIDVIISGARVTWVLSDLAKQIEAMTRKDFQAQVAPLTGLASPAFLAAPNTDQLRTLFVQENVKLINSLPTALVGQIEQIVSQGLRQGTPVKALERDIREKLGLTRKKAQLIARDQISKYSGDLTRHNQASAGITHYTWETSRDERVRPEHKALDGKVFAWNAPPVSARNGGRYHPRQGINCRCDAIPVI